MKITITGGHLTPALAMIDFLQSHHSQAELSFIGRTHSRVDQRAVEQTEVLKRKVKFVSLVAPKFAMVPIWVWLFRFGQLLASAVKARQILSLERPDCVLSFGGYLAVPVVLAAWWLKIPVITHEQTRAVGLANRVIGKLAKFVGVAFPESLKFFDSTKTFVVGSPIRPGLFQLDLAAPSWFKNPHQLPTLVITGGSQGSRIINQVIDQLLPSLVSDWYVVHQRGPDIAGVKTSPPVLAGYYACEWLSETELFWLWKQPNAISISRAGANTVSELAAIQVPAILIPLPVAYQDEQKLNAQWLADQSGAYVLDQPNLTADSLLALIKKVTSEANQLRSAMTSKSKSLTIPAVEQLWQLIILATQP